MADFKLIPNFYITAVQTVIFFINIYIVNFFFVKPYLRLRKKRYSLTEGNVERADELNRESETREAAISVKYQTTQKLIEEKREQALELAKKTRENVVAKAREDSSLYLSSMREELKVNLEEEQKNIASKVDNLFEQLKQKLVQ